MENVISQVTSDEFAFSEDGSDVAEGEGIYAYQGSSSAVREAAEILATNTLSSDPSTEDEASRDCHEGIVQEDFSGVWKYPGLVLAY